MKPDTELASQSAGKMQKGKSMEPKKYGGGQGEINLTNTDKNSKQTIQYRSLDTLVFFLSEKRVSIKIIT